VKYLITSFQLFHYLKIETSRILKTPLLFFQYRKIHFLSFVGFLTDFCKISFFYPLLRESYQLSSPALAGEWACTSRSYAPAWERRIIFTFGRKKVGFKNHVVVFSIQINSFSLLRRIFDGFLQNKIKLVIQSYIS